METKRMYKHVLSATKVRFAFKDKVKLYFKGKVIKI